MSEKQQNDIEWVSPIPLVPTEEMLKDPSFEPLDPAAYLHTLHQQTTCCASALDDYIAKIQVFLQSCSDATSKSTEIHKASTNQVLLSVLDYSDSVDQLLNRFSQIEQSVAGLAELNAEVKDLRKKVEQLEVFVRQLCFKK
ncbi:hypothetical protein EDI_330930 [Entamoeba dispar SAW760]|uniref:BLOC-1-related complex subunit 6 C-terminal helix domain-containing protein n=1 Tax=Entamoeba dispar (strain ATCC PRA-260 / SAW760) TaxID=370354 RepID=B0EUC0_ENTDS|nr:uncharacterized protein EDI_330930 [Entamoeba dispar SAW760]EDR21871.1 hypothetical protein EDI_330930 [Entamoeba dispar SAW760]|eukprot:EDR21871.1 hypothetical protein EDI_330930 [Entamoeba dispar SAW760]